MEKWTEDVVEVLHKIRRNSYYLSNKHRIRYINYKAVSRYFDLPVIITSVFSSSFTSLNITNSENKNLINTCISMFIAILTSIKLYMNLNNNINEEISLSKDYYILSINIFKTLNLEPENRRVNSIQFLNDCYATYIKLTEQSTLLYKSIKQDELTIDMKQFPDLDSSSELDRHESRNILIIDNNSI